jgi:hypothetical protein
MKFYSLREKLSIAIDRWSYRIRSMIENWEKFLRVWLGRNEFYCPGCLKKSLWWDFRWGDGPKGRCLEGCNGEWFRVLTAEEVEIAKDRGYKEVTRVEQVVRKRPTPEHHTLPGAGLEGVNLPS